MIVASAEGTRFRDLEVKYARRLGCPGLCFPR
jgi:hypothetical protein